ncbi:MAG: UbiA family prenyltransferase [Gammaproteobacteria bacterium]|nr:UbiA family prenyltransferase [Gammaproteobacteria bacterium]
MKLKALYIIRPVTSFAAAFLSLSAYYSLSPASFNLYDALLIVLLIFSLGAISFIVNDVLDIEKDRISHPDRPLITNDMSSREASGLAALLFIAIIVFAHLLKIEFSPLFLFVILGSLFYSVVNNSYGCVANLIASLLSASLVLIGVDIIPTKPSLLLICSGVSIFFLILGREILLDVLDIEADARINKKSLPLAVGKTKAYSIAKVSVFISVLVAGVAGLAYGNYIYIAFYMAATILTLSAFITRSHDIESISYTFKERTRTAFFIFSCGVGGSSVVLTMP